MPAARARARRLLMGWEDDRKQVLTVFLLFSVSLVFGMYPSIYWEATGPGVNADYVWNQVQPFRTLINHHTFNQAAQGSFYIGNPFFLIPIVQFLGWTPATFKLISVFFMAVTGPILFFAYRSRYGLRRGVLMVLVLFLLLPWYTYRVPDIPYVLFFIGVFLHLFMRWHDNGRRRTIYLIALLTGFATYLKAIFLYPVIGLFLGVLIADWRRFWNRFDGQTIAACIGLFLIGYLPGILYFSNHPALGRLAGSLFSSQEYPLLNILNTFGRRVQHLVSMTTPALRSEQVQFLLHPILLLGFIGGTFVGLFQDRARHLSIAAITMFLLTFYTHGKLFDNHLIILYPVLPLLFIQPLSLISDEALRTRIEWGTLVVFLVLTLASHVQFADHPQSYRRNNPEVFTATAYDDIRRLNLSTHVVTNHFHAYGLASFDRRVEQVTMLSELNWTQNVVQRSDQQPLPPGKLRFPANTTLLLATAERCPRTTRALCGYGTDTVLQKLEAPDTNRTISLGGFTYLLLNGGTPGAT